MNRQKLMYTLAITGIVIIFLWLLSSQDPNFTNPKIAAAKNKAINNFEIYNLNKEWFLQDCMGMGKESEKMSLEFLPEYIETLKNSKIGECQLVASIFFAMFEIEKTFSKVELGPEFSKRVLGWLDNNPKYLEQARNQKIIKLYNKYTNEEMIFNPLRGKRPIKKPEVSDEKFTFDMINESKAKCDFCNDYTKNTASDIFGRIETDFSYTAANTFKYDKWHALILSRNHNPMDLSKAEFADMFNLSLKWFQKVNQLDSNAQYPEMIWDCMPKSGASQVHPHFQLSMGSQSYYGGMRRWLDASQRYYKKNQRNFYDDFILIHKALGLTYKQDNAYVVANLIPIKEQEFIFIGENSQSGYDNLVDLLHKTIKVFVKDLEQFSWSTGMYLPKYRGNQESFFTEQTSNENDGILDRIILRIVFRTPAAALRADYNGLDMYTSSVLGIDRYTIANKLFSHLN